MATTKVFKSGNSQALRLPKEFRMRGDEILLRDKPRTTNDAFELLADLAPFERDDGLARKRKGL